jgi:hypothetical protein
MAPRACSISSNYLSELERSSRLGLTWGDAVWLGRCPQVKRALSTFSGGSVPVLAGRLVGAAAWLPVPAGVGLGDGEAELLEFGDELVQAAGLDHSGRAEGLL